jgi:hypothetical protein
MDFARTLYISKIYESVEALPGVYAVTVKRFNRTDVKKAPDIPSDGRIVSGDFEIPTLAALNIAMEGESL